MKLVSAKYAFVSAYLKGEEARGVTSLHLDEMAQRASIQEMIEVLRDTDLGDYLAKDQPKDFEEADGCLGRYMGDCMTRLRRFHPPSEIMRVADAFLTKYDVLNTKIALRQLISTNRSKMTALGRIAYEGHLELLANASNSEEIADVLKKSGLKSYASIVREVEIKDERSEADVESRLEGEYYENLSLSFKKVNDKKVLQKVLGMMVDLANLRIVFKMVAKGSALVTPDIFLERGMLLPISTLQDLLSLKMAEVVARLERTEYYQAAAEINKSFSMDGDMTVIDRVIERVQLQLLRELMSPRVMSPITIFWYLYIKELEVRNVRTVLKAAVDGIPTSEIKDNLVITL